jgi:hypothetical protein
MNTIELIKNQIGQIAKLEKSVFLDSIILHLERAEYYYSLGENDNDYYNDVVYRTNQAYEGALKEAYNVLADKSQSEVTKETPYKIEKYLEDNSIFKERVLELFKNYRNEWRNKSTHDYKLFFDNSEAFIALTSVSSFVHLLLNQIIERVAFERQKSKIENSKSELYMLKEKGLTAASGIFNIVTMFLMEIDYTDLKEDHTLESELMGFLKANLKSFLDDGAIIREDVKIKGNLRPDFIIECGKDKIILEVKKFSGELNIESSLQQLLSYLEYSDTYQGIIFAFDVSNKVRSMIMKEHTLEVNNSKYTLRIISNQGIS